jgi:hypothetical protein
MTKLQRIENRRAYEKAGKRRRLARENYSVSARQYAKQKLRQLRDCLEVEK